MPSPLTTRHSTRAFLPTPVPQALLRAVLEEALRAPSWANTQPWDIFAAAGPVLKAIHAGFLDNAAKGIAIKPDLARPLAWPAALTKRRQELTAGIALAAGEANKQFGELNTNFFHAPAVIYLCMDKTLTPWSIFDLGAVSQSIMLAAEERGLGTIAAINLVRHPDVLRRELGIPDSLSIIIGIAIGYEDTQHAINRFRSARRPLDEAAVLKGF
jgi:nitroreductase